MHMTRKWYAYDTEMTHRCQADDTKMSRRWYKDVTQMTYRCHADDTQMSCRWHKDVMQMTHRCHADDREMSRRWHRDVTQMALTFDTFSFVSCCATRLQNLLLLPFKSSSKQHRDHRKKLIWLVPWTNLMWENSVCLIFALNLHSDSKRQQMRNRKNSKEKGEKKKNKTKQSIKT